MRERVSIASVRRFGSGASQPDQDLVAVESPLAIELIQLSSGIRRPLGVLMRTPGDDDELVAGLLHSEGIVRSAGDIIGMRHHPADASDSASPDRVEVTLAQGIDLALVLIERATAPTSACGLCGRLAVESAGALAHAAIASSGLRVRAAAIAGIPDALRRSQAVFAETGGLHAAGVFDTEGRLLASREDIGRHNAVDKLVGSLLQAGQLPARERVLGVSGRAAFEIVQKAALAGMAVIVAVGAPSSLAVEAARATNITLVGFARDGRFNVYSGTDRIAD